MNIRRGTIIEFFGSWHSGLGTLFIETSEGMDAIPCANGATVRALEGAFGNVIGEAHNVKNDGGHVGQDILYSTDEFGILEAFTPYNEASPELLDAFENEEVD